MYLLMMSVKCEDGGGVHVVFIRLVKEKMGAKLVPTKLREQ